MKLPDWLPSKAVGLAPMDGVTDAPYRFIQKKYGNPDIIFTEFTNVIGLCRGAERLFLDQLFRAMERPVVGQIYGSTPDDFYHAAKIIVALGFDGVDINMGCPAKSVTDSGSGAALIRTPDVAKEIIKQTRKGVDDFLADGKLTGVASNVADLVAKQGLPKPTHSISVSVKTRIGYDAPVVSEWIGHLNETELDWLSVHGRTLKQMYTGQANWDAIAEAVELSRFPVLGNGDVSSLEEADQMFDYSGVAGVLIGRGSFGNPWVFKRGYTPTWEEVADVIREHTALHVKIKGEGALVQMRKNLAWYAKGFDGAAQLRGELVRINNLDELELILERVKPHSTS